jgi:hypothetical protein
MLLDNKINEQIASELKISIRSIQNYKRRLEQRYMAYQRQKTDDTMFLECNLLKNRLLTLYKALETQVTSDKTSGTEKAKCAEIAASIALDVLKIESEGIKAVKELVSKNIQRKNILDNLHPNQSHQSKESEYDNNEPNKEYDPNRKF